MGTGDVLSKVGRSGVHVKLEGLEMFGIEDMQGRVKW